MRVEGLCVKPQLRRDCMARWHKFVELERTKPRLRPGHQVSAKALEAAWWQFARRFADATSTEELVRFGIETNHLRGEVPWPFAALVVDGLQRDQDVGELARAEGRAVRWVLALLHRDGWQHRVLTWWRGKPKLIEDLRGSTGQ